MSEFEITLFDDLPIPDDCLCFQEEKIRCVKMRSGNDITSYVSCRRYRERLVELELESDNYELWARMIVSITYENEKLKGSIKLPMYLPCLICAGVFAEIVAEIKNMVNDFNKRIKCNFIIEED